MKAVGVFAFAGLATRGVIDAGYSPVATLEDGSFGVASHRRNFTGVKVYDAPDQWPLAELADEGVDLVYGQPACAGFSIANYDKGTGNVNNDGLIRANEVGQIIRPKAFVIESVTNLFKEGDALVRGWEDTWQAIGYNTCRLTENALHAGTPQTRRRALFVAAQANLDFSYPPNPPELTVGDAISDLDGLPASFRDDPHAVHAYPRGPQNAFQVWARGQGQGVTWSVVQQPSVALGALIPYLTPGQRVDSLPESVFEKTYYVLRPKPIKPKGKPSKLYRRLHWDKPCTALTGGIHWFHPKYDRFLTVREQARCMGVPDDYVFDSKSKGRAYAEIGKAVSPLVARWAAGQIARCLADPKGREHRTVVDLIKGH